MRRRISKLEEARGLKGGRRTLGERFLRSAQRLRAVYYGEQLPPEHPGGDCVDVRSMERRQGKKSEPGVHE